MLNLNRTEHTSLIKKSLSRLGIGVPPAVVVGDSINALGVVRSLGKEGIPVVWLTSNPNSFVNASKYSCLMVSCHDVYYAGLNSALLTLGSLFHDRPVLFLTHDFQVKEVSAQRKTLSRFYQFHLSNDLVVTQLLSKSGFYELAKRTNLLTPKTYKIDNIADLSAFVSLEGERGSWVVKPFEKDDAFESLWGKAIKIDGKTQWSRFVGSYRQLNIPVIIQSWIAGEDRHICFCLAVFGADHRCLMSFSGRKIRQFKPEVGNTASAEPYPHKDIVRLTIDFFEKLSFMGMGSLEFKFSESQNAFYAVEPTVGRTNLQSELAPLNNYNLPAVYYHDVLGHRVARDALVRHSLTSARPRAWVRLGADLKSGFFYYRQGSLSLWNWLGSYLRPISFAVFRFNDPSPFFKLCIRSLSDTFKRSIKSMLCVILGKRIADGLIGRVRSERDP